MNQPRLPGSTDPSSFEVIEPPVLRGYQQLSPSSGSESSPLLHYWRIIQKRKWSVLATVTIVFALAIILTLRMTRLYQASAKIAIFPESSNTLGLKDGDNSAATEDDADMALETQVTILRSETLALKVIEAMRLDQNPRFMGRPIDPSRTQEPVGLSGLEPDPARVAGLLGRFRGGLTVQVVPRTRVIQVSYLHPDPRLAAEMANGLVKTFVEENFRGKYEAVMQTSDWLSKELSDLQLKMETSEEKLVRYQKEHSILGIDEKQNIVTVKLDSLNKDLIDAQTDRIRKEAAYRLDSDNVDQTKAPQNSNGTLMDRLRDRETDLSGRFAELTTQFGSSYPKVVELSNQLKDVRAAIAAEKLRAKDNIRGDYDAALARERMLAAAFEKQKQEANKLNESSIEYTSLKRDAETNRQLYQNLLQRLKEAGVTAGLRSSNMRVVDVARVATFPVKPNVQRNLAFGLLLGLALGVGLAFLQEGLDSTVHDLEEVTAITTLPALGTIPLQMYSNGNGRRGLLAKSSEVKAHTELVTCAKPRSPASESYRALRTSILLSASGAPPKVLLVTSALPEEGKTTISANSAIVLAQKGSRVLLVDADLRRPGVANMLGVTSEGGLSALLSGVSTKAEFVNPIPAVPTLFVLPAGPIPPQPAELLSSAIMKEYLARWRKEFDHLIIDTPPCLSVTDAVVLSVEVDKVILVARSGRTPKTALRRACELLAQVNANVMGVVLNALDVHAEHYYYYYRSKYAKRYYEVEEQSREVHTA